MRSASVILALMLGPMGGAIGAPPPALQLAPAPGAAAPAGPRSLWCETVVEMQTSRRSGVTSVWLANGVRLHHLKIDRRPGEAVVTIAICGGKLLEDAGTRGISEIAANVIDDWDAAAPNASGAEHMAGRNARIDAAAGPDAITLRLEGAVGDMESALRVAKELLTTPTVTAAAVEGARDQVVRELRLRAGDARAAVSDAINGAIVPPPPAGDPRLHPPDERSLTQVDAQGVRAWLARHSKEDGAPIECAIVGDVSLAEALHMADGTLGALPKRGRVSSETNRVLRQVQNTPGAVRKDVSSAGVAAGRVTLARGCFGPEMGALNDQRELRAAARVAMARLKGVLAGPNFAMGSSDPGGGVYVSPFAGLGMVLVSVTVDAEQAGAASEAIDAELGRMAANGPTAEELAPVAAELARSVEEFERDLRYWSATFAKCDALGIDPDDIASGAAFYKALTPERVRGAMQRYWRDEARIALTIRGPEKAVGPAVKQGP